PDPSGAMGNQLAREHALQRGAPGRRSRVAPMNILLINHYAGSVRHGMEYRPYYLAREWVRSGHRVTIVASSTSHLRNQAPVLDGRTRLDETIDGIDYVWLATPSYRGNGAARVRNMAAFVLRLWR